MGIGPPLMLRSSLIPFVTYRGHGRLVVHSCVIERLG
jgi:hypothetical protein